MLKIMDLKGCLHLFRIRGIFIKPGIEKPDMAGGLQSSNFLD